MAILVDEQFKKLNSIVRKCSKYYWSGSSNEEYSGPVDPTGICNMVIPNRNISVNFLILAERVPLKYMPHAADAYPSSYLGIVFTKLDESFEFNQYDQRDRQIGEITCECCKDGTIRGLIRNEKFLIYSIIFHKYIKQY